MFQICSSRQAPLSHPAGRRYEHPVTRAAPGSGAAAMRRRRTRDARNHAGLAIAGVEADRPRCHLSSHPRNRVAELRGAGPPHQLGHGSWPRPAGGRRPPATGHAAGGPHRHPGLEHLAARRELVWHFGHGRGGPHHQSASVRGTDRLYRQPRRRPGAVLRPDLRQAGREAGAAAQDHRTLCAAHRSGAHAGRYVAEPPLLRGSAGRRERRRTVDRGAGNRAGRPVLHQRHHRQSQGRAIQPPLQRAARHGGLRHRRVCHGCAHRRAADRAHVSRQRLVHPLYGGLRRREAGDEWPQFRSADAAQVDRRGGG